MLRKLTALVMCLVFLTITSSLFAEDVYITKQGKKYHAQDCRFVSNRQTQKISLEEATAKGLAPCSKCFAKTEQISTQETQANEDMVYATKNGQKYHKPECRLIKNRDATGISIDEAKAKGLTACSKCFSQVQAKAE